MKSGALPTLISALIPAFALAACSSGTENLADVGGAQDAAATPDAAVDSGVPHDAATIDSGNPIDTGVLDSGAPDAGPSGVGSDCTSTSMGRPTQGTCQTGQLCLPDAFGLPGGYCTVDCSGGGACPGDSVCVDLGGPSFCFFGCTHNHDCKSSDYVCQDGTCLPRNFGGDITPATNDGLACVMPVVTAPGPGSLFSASIPVSEPSPGGSVIAAECELAVNPTNHHIVIAYNDLDAQNGGSAIGVAESDNDGMSFGTPIKLPLDTTVDASQNQSDPVVGVDPAGNFFISWVGFDTDRRGAPLNFKIYVAESADGGHSWTIDNAAPTEAGDLDKPWLAVSPAGHAMMVTYERSAPNAMVSDIMMVRSSSGVSWTAPRALNDNRPLFRNLAQPVFGADGKAVAVWLELTDAQTSMFGSTNNKIYLQRLNADGSSNGTNVLVTHGTDSPTFEDPSVAVFGTNVYVGFISGDDTGKWDLRVATSTNGGASFGPSLKVNDDGTCATHFHHQIIVDAQGNLHAIWFDNRYLTGNVFHAMSPPATAAQPLVFGAATFVNDTSFTFTTSRSNADWLGDYLGIAITGGKMYAAWTDNRQDGVSRIFFASAPAP